MKMVVPAILTNEKETFVKMLNECVQFTHAAQVDIMDGKFVSSQSVTIDDLKGMKAPLKVEAHLMVNDPLAWIDVFKSFGAHRIIFHFEIEQDHQKIIKEIKQQGLETGLAVNPSTKIRDFKHLINKADMVLFMSVDPGFYGAKFIPAVLEKIQKFKEFFPHKLAGIDGGVQLANVKQIAGSGVDYICVGSAILRHSNPRRAYEEILNALNG